MARFADSGTCQEKGLSVQGTLAALGWAWVQGWLVIGPGIQEGCLMLTQTSSPLNREKNYF